MYSNGTEHDLPPARAAPGSPPGARAEPFPLRPHAAVGLCNENRHLPPTSDSAYGVRVSSCIFCAIARREAPAERVYEDDGLLAFLDVRPITRGHTLVVPRIHAAELGDLDADTGARMFRLGHRLALALRRSELAADGANLMLNDGPAAFQTVAHVHLHVVPRRHGDRLRFATGLLLRRSAEPAATAATIRAALDGPDPAP